MDPKIFFIIGTLFIGQVKPKQTAPEVPFGEKDILEIDDKVNGFADHVFLNDIQCLSQNEKFSRCFKKPRRDDYDGAIDNFAYKIREAGEALNRNPAPYSKVRVKEVQDKINELAILMLDFKTKFLQESNKSFATFKNLLECQKKEFNKKFKKVYLKLYSIKRTTKFSNEISAVEECENAIQKEVKVLKQECEKIIGVINECFTKRKTT